LRLAFSLAFNLAYFRWKTTWPSAAFDKGAKEFNESKQRYEAEMDQSKGSQKSAQNDATSTTRPMNIESLELQNQGFRLVVTLMENDDTYLKDHNDVFRAFCWLWRSKGRYLRSQHEESVPPRYHGESKLLASLLVNFSSRKNSISSSMKTQRWGKLSINP
jgi:hypothetical protein